MSGRSYEIIPDSEEERIEEIVRLNLRTVTYTIEISSDEEEEETSVSVREPVSGIHADEASSGEPSLSNYALSTGRLLTIRDAKKDRHTHEPNDVIELSDSSIENVVTLKPTPRSKAKTQKRSKAPQIQVQETDLDTPDDSLMILNDPRNSRKPFRLSKINTPQDAQYTSKKQLTSLISVPSTRTPVSSSKKCTASRASNKEQLAAELARREAYAQQLFNDLNEAVFNESLPKNTKLNWNKRLLTTAGRAKWHRSREGVNSTEIELADKILDCDERIRNTLSHEMCHLASWIIDEDPKAGHGRGWKQWASRVMANRPDIDISTKHSYEINYPFQWQCEKCSKIYGRFSKSIKIDECVCGVCKEGKLSPLFKTIQRDTRSPKISRMATEKTQEFPFSVPSSPSPSSRVAISPLHSVHDIQTLGSDSDSEIEILTTAMGTVTIID